MTLSKVVGDLQRSGIKLLHDYPPKLTWQMENCHIWIGKTYWNGRFSWFSIVILCFFWQFRSTPMTYQWCKGPKTWQSDRLGLLWKLIGRGTQYLVDHLGYRKWLGSATLLQLGRDLKFGHYLEGKRHTRSLGDWLKHGFINHLVSKETGWCVDFEKNSSENRDKCRKLTFSIFEVLVLFHGFFSRRSWNHCFL